MGAERAVNCEHMQALVTDIPETLGVAGRSQDRPAAGFYRYNTAFMASLDVRTAFDVARSSVKILTLTGVHGHLTAALLAEMQDVRGSACFACSETEFRCSRCIRQGGVEARVVGTCGGQIRAVESRREVEGQRAGGYLLTENTTMNTCCAA